MELRHSTESHGGVLPIQQLVAALRFYASASFFLQVAARTFVCFYRDKYK